MTTGRSLVWVALTLLVPLVAWARIDPATPTDACVRRAGGGFCIGEGEPRVPALTELSGLDRFRGCLPITVTDDELLAAIQAYLRRHPTDHGPYDAALAVKAWHETWGCAQTPASVP